MLSAQSIYYTLFISQGMASNIFVKPTHMTANFAVMQKHISKEPQKMEKRGSRNFPYPHAY